MKFTLNWLRDHLDTTASIEELSNTLTQIGLEVEEVIDRAAMYAPFTVAHILDTERHPDADKLQICTVDTGDAEPARIVCGAPNARKGIKVVLAKEGTTIPSNGMVLKKAKIRGVESNGMLCSESELMLGDGHAGILELPEDAIVGDPFTTSLGLNDVIFDIAITPDRGDCLGIRGIARDLAAAGLGTLKPLDISKSSGTEQSPITIDITPNTGCTEFIGCHITGVQNGESPAWLKQRLESIGLRPISRLVDVTNYISYDLGRPLHVYDANKIGGALHVRLSNEGESFQGLNDKTYTLQAGDTVIADAHNQIGLGGIVGGSANSCENDTVNILLEVAWFDPITIATSGRKYSIDTDARYRFERNVDPTFLHDGAEIATRMILELCGGKASALITAGKSTYETCKISFRPARVNTLGGIDIAETAQQTILKDLGFEVAIQNSDTWQITVPSWRPDVTGEADIVEEVLRINGYDNIGATPLPKLANTRTSATSIQTQRLQAARRILSSRGCYEAYSWSFIPEPIARYFCDGEPTLLANPISVEMIAMRPTLLAGLLQAMQRNHARGFSDLALYEGRTIFHGVEAEQQFPAVTSIRSGCITPKNLFSAPRAVDSYDAKADALAILEACGAPVANLQHSTDVPHWYHPGKSGTLRLGKNILAVFGELHPRLLKMMDIQGTIVACEVYPELIPAGKAKKSKTRPAYQVSDLQQVTRDFAFIVNADIAADDLLRTVQAVDKKLIVNVNLFDVYSGKGMEDGKKSLAITVTLQPQDATLTDELIDASSRKIIDAAEKRFGATLRSNIAAKAA